MLQRAKIIKDPEALFKSNVVLTKADRLASFRQSLVHFYIVIFILEMKLKKCSTVKIVFL